MQLIFGDGWDLDKLQTCAKGKSIFEIPFRVKGNPKNIQKIKTEQKSTKKWFDRAALFLYIMGARRVGTFGDPPDLTPDPADSLTHY